MPESFKDTIDLSKVPKHIAIIMDGNGRWAQQKGRNRLFGHLKGVNSVRSVTEGASEIGIQYLTLYVFSTENWARPKDEVSGLMKLLIQTIHKEVPKLNKNNIRLGMIGDLASLPKNVQREMNEAINETSANTGLNLIIALSYSSKWEISNAIKKILQDVKNNVLQETEIGQDTLQKYLSTADIPNPELMIRTGGEHRISNFLLYQLAYTELFFTDTKWPDFNKEKLFESVCDYQNRERRFGKIGEQVRSIL